MQWTTEQPTQDGWYWVYLFERDEICCVEIKVEKHFGRDSIFFTDHVFYQENEVSYWMGPLQLPAKPKTKSLQGDALALIGYTTTIPTKSGWYFSILEPNEPPQTIFLNVTEEGVLYGDFKEYAENPIGTISSNPETVLYKGPYHAPGSYYQPT